jgi:hypothetical protein
MRKQNLRRSCAFLENHTATKFQSKEQLLIIENQIFALALQIHQRSGHTTHTGQTSRRELTCSQLPLKQRPTRWGKPTKSVDLGSVQSTIGAPLALLCCFARCGHSHANFSRRTLPSKIQKINRIRSVDAEAQVESV